MTLLDTGEENQVSQSINRKTIYDVPVREVAWRSFVAGLFLGLGRTAASGLLWLVVLLLSVQILQPLVMPLFSQFEQLTQILGRQPSGSTPADFATLNSLNSVDWGSILPSLKTTQ